MYMKIYLPKQATQKLQQSHIWWYKNLKLLTGEKDHKQIWYIIINFGKKSFAMPKRQRVHI